MEERVCGEREGGSDGRGQRDGEGGSDGEGRE